jgi:hypothetical protein
LKRKTAIPLLDFGETKDNRRLLFVFVLLQSKVLLMKPLFKLAAQSHQILLLKPCSKRPVHLRRSVLGINHAKHTGFSRNNPKQKAIHRSVSATIISFEGQEHSLPNGQQSP